jgi:tetratricopeptide (TPR) repeat protein
MSEHELWNELGNLYFMSGAYNQAVYAYHRSIQLDSSFGRPYSNLALAYVQQGKYQEAIELYRSSIELLADNKEKAVSWSRLGNVYRHLKDYTKAVVAYQQADELDPQSTADDQPFDAVDDPQEQPTIADLPWSVNEAVSQIVIAAQPEQTSVSENFVEPDPLVTVDTAIQPIEEDRLALSETIAEMDQAPSDEVITIDSSVSTLLEDSTPDLPMPVAIEFPAMEEQWPITNPEPDPDTLDEATASWALTDLTRYQQDLSESPETGSLTIWGEPEPSGDEDWDLYPALEPDADVYQPDTDDDNLAKWMSLPEEEPHTELEALELFKELKEEMLEPDVKHSPINKASIPADDLQCSTDDDPQFLPAISEQNSTEGSRQDPAAYPLALPARSIARSETKFNMIELEVEERPFPDNPSPRMADFIVIEEPGELAEITPAVEVTAGPDVQQPVRDSQELEEIEAGIAKFKRAVQVNPQNAYAWDALGTLYKSAGLYKDAIYAYQQATSVNPPKALYFHNLGLVYACEGRDDDAIGAFQRVVEIDPDYSLAHATLGGYYRKMGLEELAQKHIGKAMKNIFDSENEYNRACLEAICGNTDHAIELLGVALKNKQTYVDWILRDPDLDFIRLDPRFKQLVSDYTR